MCHNLAKLDTDIKVTLVDKAGKVDQGTVVQKDATMDNLINLLPLPGGVTGPRHQSSGQGLPTSTSLKAIQDLKKMLRSINTGLLITSS